MSGGGQQSMMGGNPLATAAANYNPSAAMSQLGGMQNMGSYGKPMSKEDNGGPPPGIYNPGLTNVPGATGAAPPAPAPGGMATPSMGVPSGGLSYGGSFPYSSLADQYSQASANQPLSQQYSNGSQYGRWNGVNNNFMGLAPSSWGSVFGSPGPSQGQWQPPWGGNGSGYGSNQGPGARPMGVANTPPGVSNAPPNRSNAPMGLSGPGASLQSGNAPPAQGNEYVNSLLARATGQWNPSLNMNSVQSYGAGGSNYDPAQRTGQMLYGANGQATGIGGMSSAQFASVLPQLQKFGYKV